VIFSPQLTAAAGNYAYVYHHRIWAVGGMSPWRPETSSSPMCTLLVLITLTYASRTPGLGLALKFFSSPLESPMDVLPGSGECGQLFTICSRPDRRLSVSSSSSSWSPASSSTSSLSSSSASLSSSSSSPHRHRPSSVQAEHLSFSLCDLKFTYVEASETRGTTALVY
jgi:hypothetical protein